MKQEAVDTNAANRRSFLKGAGMTSLGLAGAALIGSRLGSDTQSVQAAMAIDDADILNFALNLEYLEAEFYCKATFNATLVQLGIISSSNQTGPTTGGARVPNFGNSPMATLATALRIDEIAHVQYLRKALGSAAVKKPAINLDALGYGYSSVHDWLKLARQFEDVGTSAYLGAAPLISSKAYLGAAGAILAVESFHAGAIRLGCIMNAVSSPAVDSQDIPPTAKKPFDNNSSSLAIPRTPSQVLHIVYGGGRSSGGFFPDGMNGAIVSQ